MQVVQVAGRRIYQRNVRRSWRQEQPDCWQAVWRVWPLVNYWLVVPQEAWEQVEQEHLVVPQEVWEQVEQEHLVVPQEAWEQVEQEHPVVP